LGPEGDLVPEAVSTFLVPRLCKIVDGGALDPYSEKAIRRMVDLSKEVEASVGQKFLKFQARYDEVFYWFPSAKFIK
jgi:GC-rich sequence DNA-binding factor